MVLKKRTYGLPADALDAFEKEVPAGDRSAVVANLMRNWLAEKRRNELREQVIEGCQEMAELYLEIEQEYHPLEEVHRALDDQPEPRRRRASSTRSRGRV
jgi:hypothetical protein